MSHDVVRRYHYRGISEAWLSAVTVWLFSRESVAKSPCRCGSGGGIYIGVMHAMPYLIQRFALAFEHIFSELVLGHFRNSDHDNEIQTVI